MRPPAARLRPGPNPAKTPASGKASVRPLRFSPMCFGGTFCLALTVAERLFHPERLPYDPKNRTGGMRMRRQLLRLVALAAIGFGSGLPAVEASFAQNFPERPIRFFVP